MPTAGEQRPKVDPYWESKGEPQWLRVKITTELGAEPLKTFDCIVTYPKAVPEDFFETSHPIIRDADAELWTETTREIKGVWYGIPSGDTLSAGTIGWIYYYYGRWVLLHAECN